MPLNNRPMNEQSAFSETTVSTPTTDFQIGFQFVEGVHNLNITLDDDPLPIEYDATIISDTTVRIEPAITAGKVRLMRETDIDDNLHKFSSGALFEAKEMDENFEQIRFAQQETNAAANKVAERVIPLADGLEEALQQANEASEAAQSAQAAAEEAANTTRSHTTLTDRSLADAHPASAITDASGNSTQVITDQIKTPKTFNADATGVLDATAALNALFSSASNHVIHLTSGTYLTDGVTIPSNKVVYANGAVFKRKNYSSKPVVDLQPNSLLLGAVVDGNKDTLGVGGAIADYGIRVQDGAMALYCTSDNNRSHAITARGVSFNAPTGNQKVLFCKASNNGFNAGAFGTADGFNAANSNNFLFYGCEAVNSARTAFVAETYNTNIVGEDKHDATFSVGGKFTSCKASGSGYNDFNAEVVTSPTFTDITGNLVTFRLSPYAKVLNSNLGQIYGDGANFAQVSNVNIINNTRSSDVLYLVGKAPKVSNVDVQIGTGVSLTGTAVTIQDATEYNGSVDNVTVNRANNGMNLRVADVSGLRVDTVTNVRYFIGRSNGSANITNLKQLTNKTLEVYSSAVPTQGAWVKNDIVWNTFFGVNSKTVAWICTSSGVFGSTPPVFEAFTLMSRGVAVSNASGTSPTKAEFDALLTSLRNSGHIAP